MLAVKPAVVITANDSSMCLDGCVCIWVLLELEMMLKYPTIKQHTVHLFVCSTKLLGKCTCTAKFAQ